MPPDSNDRLGAEPSPPLNTHAAARELFAAASRHRSRGPSKPEEAYKKIHGILVKAVQGTLRKFPGARLSIEDVVAEVELHILKQRDAFRAVGSSGDQMQRWLTRVAQNKTRDLARRRRTLKAEPQGRLYLDDWASDIVKDLRKGQGPTATQGIRDQDELEHLLGQLPSDERRAVELTKLEGLNSEEAAAILGRTPESVRGLTKRGLDRMRSSLREQEEPS